MVNKVPYLINFSANKIYTCKITEEIITEDGNAANLRCILACKVTSYQSRKTFPTKIMPEENFNDY